MINSEVERRLQERWMMLAEEERFIICGGMFEAEKKILGRLAPKHFSSNEVMEFVFYHMHGVTIEESIQLVPEQIP